MKKISLAEFDELLYTATFLRYYWTVFLGMNTTTKINYIHEAFITDFIDHERLAQFSLVKRTAFNKILLPENQYDYLQKVSLVTKELKELIWK